MARIRSLKQGIGEARAHPTEVDCEYRVISDGKNNLLQLSTFGSDVRASGPKVSQTIQFDRRTAEQLVEVIRRAFPGQ